MSYFRGIGAVIRTSCASLDVDSVQCEITDDVGNEMLPDLMDGERLVSFHIHFMLKPGISCQLKVINYK